MIDRKVAGVAVAAAMTLAAANASAQPTRVPLDQAATVGGIGVGCTGIGQTKNDPKWQAYSVRIEFAGPGGEYLANEVLAVSNAKGGELLEVSCEGPWILLQLPPGKSYKAVGRAGRSGAATASATVRAPSHGQASFVLHLPGAGARPE